VRSKRQHSQIPPNTIKHKLQLQRHSCVMRCDNTNNTHVHLVHFVEQCSTFDSENGVLGGARAPRCIERKWVSVVYRRLFVLQVFAFVQCSD
jgi:hypothetical protein